MTQEDKVQGFHEVKVFSFPLDTTSESRTPGFLLPESWKPFSSHINWTTKCVYVVARKWHRGSDG